MIEFLNTMRWYILWLVLFILAPMVLLYHLLNRRALRDYLWFRGHAKWYVGLFCTIIIFGLAASLYRQTTYFGPRWYVDLGNGVLP